MRSLGVAFSIHQQGDMFQPYVEQRLFPGLLFDGYSNIGRQYAL
jgi:hypothetical protein